MQSLPGFDATLRSFLPNVPESTIDEYIRSAAEVPSLKPEDLAAIITKQNAQAAQGICVRIDESELSCVTPDVPFLVDSVLIALRRLGLRTTHLIHPVIEGQSRIHAHLSPTPGPDAVQDVERTISDVHAVVADWVPMTELASAAVNQLNGVDRHILTWVCSGSFIILGAYRRGGPSLGLAARYPELPEEINEKIPATNGLIHTKITHRSPIHRDVFLDVFSAGTTVVFGLMTANTYSSSVASTPLAASRAEAVFSASGLQRDSHSGNALHQVLEAFPRDILMLAPQEDLARDIPRINASKTSVFIYPEIFHGAFACVVVIPRERFTSHLVARLTATISTTFTGAHIDTQLSVSSGPLAFMSFVASGTITEEESLSLAEKLRAATVDWDTEFLLHAPEHSEALASFPELYKVAYSPAQAAEDTAVLADVSDSRIAIRVLPSRNECSRRIKVYAAHSISLTQILPLFSNFGLTVTDERPFACGNKRVYDFGVRTSDPDMWARAEHLFVEAFTAAWNGDTEPDELDSLVFSAGLSSHQVTILRALLAYIRQGGVLFSLVYLRESLTKNPDLARAFIKYFEARFCLDRPEKGVEEEARAHLVDIIAEAKSLDDEKIARAILNVIDATVRTSAYAQRPTLAFKLRPKDIPFLPEPHPLYEIWVYSPRVEGVHLRFGSVARGGLRWSDRPEDFRTEILGLVKAQMVKNAVIVPTGSKGGFFAKNLPPVSQREAWLAEGVAAYRLFVSSLLDVTDNLVDGAVVAPTNVVRHDDDDPYLVVAADKGTAKFSDEANAVSSHYGFWLDDAFASGGSVGFDHKAMGITARGAWESVKRHFRELGVDTQSQDFTVVGIGDMSGDVFGNGMLLSPHIRLVGAFDHRSVFVDPTPDASTSYIERQRLFDLPGSSWADYDPGLISEGGGVWSREAKSIPLTPAMKKSLGIEGQATHLTPDELIRAILTAPVDLMWNGGIGTYVKAESESHNSIGDPRNNGIRVNGSQLRCRVVGEGGNLGFSQLGRIEAALTGKRINTDAVDNSAGVDTSDHEVNIKILLASLMEAGELDLAERNKLLEEITQDVGTHVLRDNYVQNVLLGNMRALGTSMVGSHMRLMHWLEERGDLDRALEFLPSDTELLTRAQSGTGLTSPELSVLMAYTKIALKDELIATDLPDDPWFHHELQRYFPSVIVERFGKHLTQHRLAREIITNALANRIVNQGGLSFVLRAQEDTSASYADVARAFSAATSILGMESFTSQIEELDNLVPTEVQTNLYLNLRRTIDDLTRYFLLGKVNDLESVVGTYGKIATYFGSLSTYMTQDQVAKRDKRIAQLKDYGVPATLAETITDSAWASTLVEALASSTRMNRTMDDVLALTFEVVETFRIRDLLEGTAHLAGTERWDAMAQSATAADLRAVAMAIVSQVVEAENLDEWVNNHPLAKRTLNSVADLASKDNITLAMLTVTLRSLRALV